MRTLITISVFFFLFAFSFTLEAQKSARVKQYLGTYRYQNLKPTGRVVFRFRDVNLAREGNGRIPMSELLYANSVYNDDDAGALSEISVGGVRIPTQKEIDDEKRKRQRTQRRETPQTYEESAPLPTVSPPSRTVRSDTVVTSPSLWSAGLQKGDRLDKQLAAYLGTGAMTNRFTGDLLIITDKKRYEVRLANNTLGEVVTQIGNPKIRETGLITEIWLNGSQLDVGDFANEIEQTSVYQPSGNSDLDRIVIDLTKAADGIIEKGPETGKAAEGIWVQLKRIFRNVILRPYLVILAILLLGHYRFGKDAVRNSVTRNFAGRMAFSLYTFFSGWALLLSTIGGILLIIEIGFWVNGVAESDLVFILFLGGALLIINRLLDALIRSSETDETQALLQERSKNVS